MSRSAWMAALLLLLGLALPACGDGNGTLDDDDSGDDDDATGDDDDATGDDDDATGDDDDATGDDDDSTQGAVSVVGTNPLDQATDVPLSTSIYIDFDGETDGTIALADSAGTAIAGLSLMVAPERLTFQADTALVAGETYTATATYTGGTHAWSFTTDAAAGTPLGLDPLGLSFAWDITGGNVVSPPAAAQFLSDATQVLLTEVTSTDSMAGTLTLMGATAEDDGVTQNLCQPTVDIPEAGADPAVWADPYFSAGPAEFSQTIPLDLMGQTFEVDVVLHGVTFEGEFTSSNSTDIDAISNGSLYFWIDGRDLDLGFIDLCSALSFVGVSCTPCPNDAEPQCVVTWVENMTAAVVPGLDLEPRDQATIDADTTNCP